MKPKTNKKRIILAVPRKSVSLKKARKTFENPDASQDNLDDAHNKSMTPQLIESSSVDVSNITLHREYAEKAVKNLRAIVNRDSESQELFEDDKVVLIQVAAGKILKGPMKTLNITLTHSILPADHEILLITPDVKDDDKNYEKNIEHYTELLDNNDVKGISKIIPMHKLRAEYGEYEMQNKLMGLYDSIICDQSVINYVKSLMGGIITKRHTHLAGLKLQASNLKAAFEKAIASTRMIIHSKGDSFAMNIGHVAMDEKHLVDNVMAAADGLKAKYPGGFESVLGLFLKTPKSKSIQFYKSISNFAIMTPPIIATSARKQNVTDELSTAMDARVTVTSRGNVYVLDGDGKRNRKQTQRLQMPVPEKRGRQKRKANKTGTDDTVGGKKKRVSSKTKAETKSPKPTKERPVKAAAKAVKGPVKAEKAAPKSDKRKLQENGKEEETAVKVPKQAKGKNRGNEKKEGSPQEAKGKKQENGKKDASPKEAKGKNQENGKEAASPKEAKGKAVKQPKAKGSKVEKATIALPKERKAKGKEEAPEKPGVSNVIKKKSAPKRKNGTDGKESKVVAKKKGKVPAA